jgi:hypothetical protein
MITLHNPTTATVRSALESVPFLQVDQGTANAIKANAQSFYSGRLEIQRGVFIGWERTNSGLTMEIWEED